jgi:hypothetical protein
MDITMRESWDTIGKYYVVIRYLNTENEESTFTYWTDANSEESAKASAMIAFERTVKPQVTGIEVVRSENNE